MQQHEPHAQRAFRRTSRETLRGGGASSDAPTLAERSQRAAVPEWLHLAAAVAWRVFVIGAAVYYAGQALGYLHVVVVPLVLALFVAALLEPPARWLEKALPASLAAFIALLLGTGLLGGVLVVVGVNVAHRLPDMASAIGNAWTSLVQSVQKLPFGPDKGELASSLEALETNLGSQLGQVAKRLAAGAQSLFLVISQLLLTMAFGFFLIRDGRDLFAHVARRFDDPREARLRAVGARAWMTIGRYFRGLALIALANTAMKVTALLIIGIPLVIPIAVLTFIGSFIPFAGPIIAGTVAALVALTHGGLTDAVLIIAASFGIQMIEGNVLQPTIMGRTMQLHPMLILAGVVVGAIVAGLGGAFIAVPLMAAVKNGFHAARESLDGPNAASSEPEPGRS